MICSSNVGLLTDIENHRPHRMLQRARAQLLPGRVAPSRYLPGAPTDPGVRTLAHPAPQPTGSPSTWVPEAIRSSYGDMHKNGL